MLSSCYTDMSSICLVSILSFIQLLSVLYDPVVSFITCDTSTKKQTVSPPMNFEPSVSNFVEKLFLYEHAMCLHGYLQFSL